MIKRRGKRRGVSDNHLDQSNGKPRGKSESAIRGREKFARYERSLNVISWIFRHMPSKVRSIAWNLAQHKSSLLGMGFRYSLLSAMGAKLGRSVFVGPNVTVVYPENLEVGNNVSIHRGCYLDALGGLKIGNDVSVAHDSSIITFEHTWGDPEIPIRDNPLRKEPISIANDVWIGCGARILAGVTIGSRSVIAAGAVVVHPIPDNSLAGGVPAKLLKKIGADE